MKAVVYKGNGLVALEEKPKPELMLDTDAIVRVTLTTICSSDIHIKHGAVPRAVPGTILGHEFVGVVEEVDNDLGSLSPGVIQSKECVSMKVLRKTQSNDSVFGGFAFMQLTN